MALSSIFSNIEKAYGKLIKGAFDEAKKQGAENTDTLYYMMTTTGKVLFDIKDRRSLDDSLVKVGGDVAQGILLKFIFKDGKLAAKIDAGLIVNGYSLGNLLLTLKHANEVSFSQGYIYKPEGLTVQGIYMPGQYFRVGTITGLDGIIKIYTDPSTGQFMSAEVISKAMYESVHPDYMDLYKYEQKWAEIDNIVNSFSPDHIVNYENGVLSVTFPDGHIEAKDLENINNVIYGGTKDDDLYGIGGNDVLYGNGGDDYIEGGTGNDTLVGGVGSDGLVGGEGNDTLIGTNGYGGDDGVLDTLNGGNGYDNYIAGNHDRIYDNDGSGAVYLGGEHLDGGEKKVIKHIDVTTTNYTKTFIYCECKTVTKWSDVTTNEWKESEEFYIDKATGTKYILSGSTLSVISSSGTITINNFSNGQLGIHLGEKETIDKKNVERKVFLQEDFCSPLILDINNNGTSSTRLGNSQTYFDMDGDGFKERTAWVERGDGLLVLDRNGNWNGVNNLYYQKFLRKAA